MTIKKEENGHFENGDPAFVIWNGEEFVAGPLREKEADAMLKELKPKKKPAAKKTAKNIFKYVVPKDIKRDIKKRIKSKGGGMALRGLGRAFMKGGKV